MIFNQTLVLNGGFMTVSGTSSANNITFTGAATMTAAVTLTDNDLGTTTFLGNIGEAGGARALTLNGPGTLALTPTSGANTYSGGTTVNMTGGASFGTVKVNLGSTTSPTSTNPLNSSSLGSGTLTFGAAGVLQRQQRGQRSTTSWCSRRPPATWWASPAPNLRRFSPSLDASVTLALAGTPTTLLLNTNVTFNGTFTGAVTAALTLSGVPIVSGSTTISPSASAILTLTGPTSLPAVTTALTVIASGGTLDLSGTGSLVSAGTSAVTINQGGGLTLDNGTTNQIPVATGSQTNRLTTTSTLAFNGGTLMFNGSNTANTTTTQTLGNVTFAAGNSQIVSTQGSGGPSALALGSYTQTLGAVVVFQAGATPGSQTFTTNTNAISFSSGYSGASTGIVPNAYVIDGSTVNGVTSSFKMATSSGLFVIAQQNYATLSTTGGNLSTDNVLVTASPSALTAPDTFNSLLIVGDGISIGGNALTVNNGVVSTLGSALTSNGNSLAATTPLLSTSANGLPIYTRDGSLTLNAPVYTTAD